MGVQVITIVSARLCELSAVSQKVVASRWRHFRTVYDVCMSSIVVLSSTQQYKSYEMISKYMTVIVSRFAAIMTTFEEPARVDPGFSPNTMKIHKNPNSLHSILDLNIHLRLLNTYDHFRIGLGVPYKMTAILAGRFFLHPDPAMSRSTLRIPVS